MKTDRGNWDRVGIDFPLGTPCQERVSPADAPQLGAPELSRLAPKDREEPDRFIAVNRQAHVVLAGGLPQDLLTVLVHCDAEESQEVLLVVAMEGASSVQGMLDEIVVVRGPRVLAASGRIPDLDQLDHRGLWRARSREGRGERNAVRPVS